MTRTSLPPMAHCDGCAHEVTPNACCTMVRARPQEVKAIRHYVRDHDIQWQQNSGIQCGFLQDGQCSIYAVRPWVCRAFGVVTALKCSRFPEDATIEMEPRQAQLLRLSDPDDELLGYYFEPNYYDRMKAALTALGA